MKVGVIGAGTMGQGIAKAFAQTLIMDSPRLTLLMVRLALRFGSTKEKYFLQREIRKEELSNVNA